MAVLDGHALSITFVAGTGADSAILGDLNVTNAAQADVGEGQRNAEAISQFLLGWPA